MGVQGEKYPNDVREYIGGEIRRQGPISALKFPV
jgi:hypothetical protein